MFLTSILIFLNWGTWIYAISVNKIIDASYGYFIFPILNVYLGYIFLKEKLNNKRILAISAVFLSSIYLLFNLDSFPWVGFLVAIFWSSYNLLRKKINVDTDVGLFIESIFILPIALVIAYLIYETGNHDFSYKQPLNILMFFFGWSYDCDSFISFHKRIRKNYNGYVWLNFFYNAHKSIFTWFFLL